MSIDLNWRPTSYSDFNRLPASVYLPDYLPGEVEIARIMIESILEDIISIRARWRSGRYRYRVVDEHGVWVELCRKSSMKPLTLGQLIDLIQGSNQVGDPYAGNGLLEGLWNCSWSEGGSSELEDAVNFAHVKSDYYSELSAWYQERGRQWRIERVQALQRERMEECSYCEKEYDPESQDTYMHDCEEERAYNREMQVQRKQRKEAWHAYPLTSEIQEVFDDWWTAHGSERMSETGERGDFAFPGNHAFRPVAQHIIDTIRSTGSMPSGFFTAEFLFRHSYLRARRYTTQVDFATLADKANVIRKQYPDAEWWMMDVASYFEDDDPPALPESGKGDNSD